MKISFCLELKQTAEIPESEAKERHQKLWDGNIHCFAR